MALATQAGQIQMFPALKVRPHATVAEFDARFPDGADYGMLKLPDDTKPVAALDAVLRDIADAFGRPTTAFVALQMEYPQP